MASFHLNKASNKVFWKLFNFDFFFFCEVWRRLGQVISKTLFSQTIKNKTFGTKQGNRTKINSTKKFLKMPASE